MWLNHKVLPRDERGYGYLISRTLLGARKLHAELREAAFFAFSHHAVAGTGHQYCLFRLHHAPLITLAELNEFNERVYAPLSLNSHGASPESPSGRANNRGCTTAQCIPFPNRWVFARWASGRRAGRKDWWS
jgi:hypothetical protein